jgi:hypothetical protein
VILASFQADIAAAVEPNLTRVLAPPYGPKLVPVIANGTPIGPLDGDIEATLAWVTRKSIGSLSTMIPFEA